MKIQRSRWQNKKSKKEYKKKIDLKKEIDFLKKEIWKEKIRILDLGSGFGFFKRCLMYGIKTELKYQILQVKIQKMGKIYNYDLEKVFSKDQLNKLKKFDVISVIMSLNI